MFGFIQGKILTVDIESQTLCVVNNNLGYEVVVSRSFCETAQREESVNLFLHTQVKEDAIVFYGFLREEEKLMFRKLLTVSGLGPKTALSLLSFHGLEALVNLIQTKNSKAISEAPGAGKKIAEKLIIELENKIEKWLWLAKISISDRKTHISKVSVQEHSLKEDLSSALQNLGYAPQQIKLAFDKLYKEDEFETLGFEESLKGLLKEMSRRPFN